MTFQPRTLSDGRVCCSNPDALCAACKTHHGDDSYAPPDPYNLAGLRAAHDATLSPFEQQWRNERLDALALEIADNAAYGDDQFETPRLTAAELADYAAPDGWALALQRGKP